MKLEDRNLSTGLAGDDVKLLQTELGQLGFHIAGEEIDRGTFGPATDNAVPNRTAGQFQLQPQS